MFLNDGTKIDPTSKSSVRGFPRKRVGDPLSPLNWEKFVWERFIEESLFIVLGDYNSTA